MDSLIERITEKMDDDQEELIKVEQKILSTLSTYKTEFVPFETNFGTRERIWTISLNTESSNTPLVLLHGFGAGIGIWALCFEPLSEERPVYAMDMLGFGRSSRPEFSNDNYEAENQMIYAIEAWRKQKKLEKFILMGHSMGTYFSALYAMSYPESVEHLILLDAWGFSDKYENPSLIVKIIAYFLQRINPMGSVRSMGPYWGPLFLQKTRRDIFSNFYEKLKDESVLPSYIYHCNTANPTGEKAFYSMVLGAGWAKSPLIKRINRLRDDIPMTFLYGSKTWMDKDIAQKIKLMRTNSYVDIQTIKNAGHHIYAEQVDDVNKLVIEACKLADRKRKLATT